MAAETRWVEYSVAATTSTYTATTSGVGTRGQVRADSSVGDKFTIGPTTCNLELNIDSGTNRVITLTSGTDLDARFVARDITEKMHVMGITDDDFDHATCVWENNAFHIYSGSLGAGSAVLVSSGTNPANDTLGFTLNTPTSGATHSYNGAGNTYTGGITASGTWEGMFDETYTVVINNSANSVGSPSAGGGNTYGGTITAGGQFNAAADDTYTITINTSAGSTVGGGTGNVPTFSWTSTPGGDNSSSSVEILYADHWYNIGTKGLKVKWTDKIFGNGDSWTVACTKPVVGAAGPLGTAQYVWTSDRGDECSAPITTSIGGFTRLGTRGLNLKFSGGGGSSFGAGDEFRVVCTGPQPSNYNITSINYGNVTVTTESPVKCVVFEIMGGAVIMDAVKFGLQNHGSFSYHGGGGDTQFRFGTVGGKNAAGASPTIGKEWRTAIVASDLSGTTPNYLHATKADLSVVATADDSEAIGNYQAGLISDFIYLCIRLGADETGSNSSINFRAYFDYS